MIEQDRLTGSSATDIVEVKLDNSIRPASFTDYVGQREVVNQLKIFISAARKRQEALDHVLIFGPPGLGKTTLANIIAAEMQGNIHHTSGPALDKQGDVAAILTNMQANDILFIDEIHRLNSTIEEVLYPAMEDRQLDIIIGEGPAARSVKIDLAPFTLVAATTKTGALTSPLRDRFGIVTKLQFYNEVELAAIISRSSKILNIEIEKDGANEIACRSRGTPRIANRLLRRVRDYAEVKAAGVISAQVAREALSMLGIDENGFDSTDRKLLQTIVRDFNGGPVGVESLSAALSDERSTIEDVLEPFLIQQGYIARTSRGRIATEKACKLYSMPDPVT
ncbi:MAG: Holliday junction branch migration DNA helicase RuvB [Legionellales bacterium]|jgi:holliday junction DNA helicase RuvB|nr:Holliday junction branch migration DNA helicase RuvB [Legionellales bacterium]